MFASFQSNLNLFFKQIHLYKQRRKPKIQHPSPFNIKETLEVSPQEFFSIKRQFFRSLRDSFSLTFEVIPPCRIHSCKFFFFLVHKLVFLSLISCMIMSIISLLHAFFQDLNSYDQSRVLFVNQLTCVDLGLNNCLKSQMCKISHHKNTLLFFIQRQI